MEKTWKPTVAGILDIISGVSSLIGVLALIIAIVVTSSAVMDFPGVVIPEIETIPGFVPIILSIIAGILAFVGILAIVGGIYALQRKNWGLALAGSIAAILASIPLLGGLPIGLTATILTALSKDEFQ